MQRPPLFESDSFIYWKNRFETYVKSKDLDLWHVITDGDFQPIIQNPETKLDEVVPFEKQTDDLKRRLAKNNEAKMVIYNALPRKEYERIFMCNTAKDIWKTLLITHQGNNQFKDNKINLLVQQYEQFAIYEDESIDSVFARFNTIITSLKALDEGYSSKNYLIGNVKVHEMIIKKDSKIVKAKGERRSLALKAKRNLVMKSVRVPEVKMKSTLWRSIPHSSLQVLATKKTSKVLGLSSCRDYRHGLKKVCRVWNIEVDKIVEAFTHGYFLESRVVDLTGWSDLQGKFTKVRIKALLEHQGLAAGGVTCSHNCDLASIDTIISDEDHALLLLTSLPSYYDDFVETLLYGRDTLKLEDVLATLNYRELDIVYTSPSTLIGGDPRKNDTVDMKEAQGNKAYTLEEFDFKVVNTKGAEKLAANHLSKLENPHKDVLEKKNINEHFPLETFGVIYSKITPWFADYANFHAGNFIIKVKSTQQKRKPTVCHHSANLTARKDFDQLPLITLKRAVSRGVKSMFETYSRKAVGENRASWSYKLDDALWAFCTAFKTPIGCTPYKLVYGKSCHLPIELEHRAYWALKHANFDLKTAERTKKLHDSKIKNRIFNVGDQVLLFNSRLKIFSGKLKTRWSGPFTITKVFPYGTIELSQPDGPNFKVNGHRVKHYFEGDLPPKVVQDLHTLPKDE
ncbi:reverse transcriptase domain-containing protein [Tanacetum coccineum]